MNPDPFPPIGDQPTIAQQPEVARDLGLGQVERMHQFADAQLAVVGKQYQAA